MNSKIHILLNRTFLIFVLAFQAVSYTSCKDDDENKGSAFQGDAVISFTIPGKYNDGTISKSAGSRILDTYTQKLSDDVNLVATLETGTSITKAAVSFLPGVGIRVLAVEAGTSDIHSSAVFYTKASATDTHADLHVSVDPGKTYDFYCISYNSTTDIPPVPAGNKLPFTVPLTKESFLMVKKPGVSIDASHSAFTFDPLAQMLTQVKVNFDTSLDIPIVSADAEFRASYDAVNVDGDGNVSLPTTPTPIKANKKFTSFTLNSPTAGKAISNNLSVYTNPALSNSNPVTFDNNNFYIHISELKAQDTVWTNLNSYFNKTLAKGSRYTINITMERTSFAGSNIYWVSKGGGKGYFTFDDRISSIANRPTNEKNQGVFFKWGSLTGISPIGGSPYTIYVPDGAGDWDQRTESNYAAIDYLSDLASGMVDDKFNNYLISRTYNSSEVNKIGDICRYIAEKNHAPGDMSKYTWRMPTRQEFLNTNDDGATWANEETYGWYVPGGTASWTLASSNEADGTFDIAFGAKKLNVFFPLSGTRNQTGLLPVSGTIPGVGYWSGSASGSSTKAHAFNFDQDGYYASTSLRSAAYPIRCVRVKK